MMIHKKIPAALSALLICAGTASCQPVLKADNESAAAPADNNTDTSEADADQGLIVEELGTGVYSLDFPYEYDLDNYLTSDVKTVEELDKWFMDNLTNGLSTEGSEYDIACSAFALTTGSGDHLFGRNYDLRPTDAMFIRTRPDNGYASIGIVDLAHLNVGLGAEAAVDSAEAQSLLMAAPYCICDGINEKGLGVSLLQLDTEHIVNDTDKHDLLVYTALRALLDKCADVDEAVSFLSEYDIYSPSRFSYHIFLTDVSGKSAAAEWIDGEMKIVEDNAATNFVLFEAPATRDPDGRYFKLRKALDENTVDCTDDAMQLLETVKQKDATRWSAVYDLDDFTAEVCFNADYENRYEFDGKGNND